MRTIIATLLLTLATTTAHAAPRHAVPADPYADEVETTTAAAKAAKLAAKKASAAAKAAKAKARAAKAGHAVTKAQKRAARAAAKAAAAAELESCLDAHEGDEDDAAEDCTP